MFRSRTNNNHAVDWDCEDLWEVIDSVNHPHDKPTGHITIITNADGSPAACVMQHGPAKCVTVFMTSLEGDVRGFSLDYGNGENIADTVDIL